MDKRKAYHYIWKQMRILKKTNAKFSEGRYDLYVEACELFNKPVLEPGPFKVGMNQRHGEIAIKFLKLLHWSGKKHPRARGLGRLF